MRLSDPNELMECDAPGCGHCLTRRQVDERPRSANGESVCPECGAHDSFQKAVVCGECRCRPCCCKADAQLMVRIERELLDRCRVEIARRDAESKEALTEEALVLIGQGDYEKRVYPRDIQGCWLARMWAWVLRRLFDK